jgi:hypothetical protein
MPRPDCTCTTETICFNCEERLETERELEELNAEECCVICGREYDECEAVGECYDEDEEPRENMTDVEADADTLASAGFGTDEDYGYYGGDDDGW